VDVVEMVVPRRRNRCSECGTETEKAYNDVYEE